MTLSLAIVVMLTALFVCDAAVVSRGSNYILTFVYFPAIIVLFHTCPFETLLNWKALGFISLISFHCFTWHSSVFLLRQTIMLRSGMDMTESYGSMFLATFLSILVGICSYHLIEVPVKRAMGKKKLT